MNLESIAFIKSDETRKRTWIVYNDRISNRTSASWRQTILYEIVEAIGEVLGVGEEHRITGIMLDFGNSRRLRSSRRWARIKFVSPLEKPRQRHVGSAPSVREEILPNKIQFLLNETYRKLIALPGQESPGRNRERSFRWSKERNSRKPKRGTK